MNLNALRAGYAQADITPPLGLQLAGGPFRPAQRILQPLLTKALVLERGADRLLLITGDLLGFDENLATSIRREIATQTGIPLAAIMLTATHTHGGPATVDLGEWGQPDSPYLLWLHGTLVGLAPQALQTLAPARVGAGAIDCPGVGVNRARTLQPVVDDRLCVVRVDDATGRLRVVILNFGCHPVNLHSTNSTTPDYPGHIDLGVPVLFTLGACGDVNPANFDPERSVAKAGETAGRSPRRARCR